MYTAKPTVLTAKPNFAQGLLELLWYNLFCRTHTNQAAKPTPHNIIIKYSVYKNKLIKHKHLTIQNTDTPTKVIVLVFVCFVALCLFLFRCCVFVFSLLVLVFLDVGFFVWYTIVVWWCWEHLLWFIFFYGIFDLCFLYVWILVLLILIPPSTWREGFETLELNCVDSLNFRAFVYLFCFIVQPCSCYF